MTHHVAALGHGRWSTYAKSLRNKAWLTYACEFHKAARRVGSPIVRAFLIGQALELYLKTFLLAKGYGERALKTKFRHDLEKLLATAEQEELSGAVHISPTIRNEIAALNCVFRDKALQYFSLLHLLTSPRVPSLRSSFRLADAMNRELSKALR